NGRLLDPRRSGYRFRRSAVRRNVESTGLEFVRILGIAFMPDSGNFRLLVARGICLGYIRLGAALLLDVSGDDLRSDAGGQGTVLAAFEQARNDDLRIPARSYPDEPTVVFVLALLLRAHLGLELVGDGLSAAGLAGEVHAVDVRASGGSHRRHD